MMFESDETASDEERLRNIVRNPLYVATGSSDASAAVYGMTREHSSVNNAGPEMGCSNLSGFALRSRDQPPLFDGNLVQQQKPSDGGRNVLEYGRFWLAQRLQIAQKPMYMNRHPQYLQHQQQQQETSITGAERVNAVAWHPTELSLAGGSTDGIVRIWTRIK